MRYLLLFALFAAVAYWLRVHHGRNRSVQRPKDKAVKPPVPMLLCSHCGVHLPGNEAVNGRRGTYCSLAHQQLAGD